MTGSTNTGLGGYKYLRGAKRNRVVGDGVVYGNFEMRWKFARMNWIKQKFYWGLNAFVDVGQVTKTISIQDKLPNVNEPIANYFKSGAEKMHGSYGAGLRLAMNQNFIIALDYGMVMDKQDGDSGLYIGLNYLF
jgi:hemolysin activation/secretion protein